MIEYLRVLFNRVYCILKGYPAAGYISVNSRIIGRAKIRVGRASKIFSGVTLDARMHPALAPHFLGGQMGNIIIGDNCKIKDGTKMYTYGGTIEIGDSVSINPYCMFYGNGNLRIGRNVLIATHTTIVASNHNFGDTTELITNQGMTCKGIVIGDNVWIGAGVTILDGSVIGEGVVIGAGAVVSGIVEAYSVVAGIPAKTIRRLK